MLQVLFVSGGVIYLLRTEEKQSKAQKQEDLQQWGNAQRVILDNQSNMSKTKLHLFGAAFFRHIGMLIFREGVL